MNNTNYGHSAPAKQQAALTPEQRAAKRQAAAQQRAEWEERVRSTDPYQRGAGWWPPIVSAEDEPMHEYEWMVFLPQMRAIESLADLGPAKVARVIDPNVDPLRDRVKPARAINANRVGPRPREDIWAKGFTYVTKPKAQKAFLEWAAFFGAIVIELRDRHKRRWVFEVALSPRPGAGCKRIMRWVLSLRDTDPAITQSQLPADLPMLSEERAIIRPRHFPEDARLDRLIDKAFDPTLAAFEVAMFRRNARDLRKGLFGASGLRDVPDHGGGVMEFPLPRRWTLALDYRPCSVGDFDRPGEVMAYFIPPEADEQGVAA